jgi:hypothetical protein
VRIMRARVCSGAGSPARAGKSGRLRIIPWHYVERPNERSELLLVQAERVAMDGEGVPRRAGAREGVSGSLRSNSMQHRSMHMSMHIYTTNHTENPARTTRTTARICFWRRSPPPQSPLGGCGGRSTLDSARAPTHRAEPPAHLSSLGDREA